MVSKCRTNGAPDHCVLAWRTDKAELIHSEEIEFDESEHVARRRRYYEHGNVAILGVFRLIETGAEVVVISAHLTANPAFEGAKYA
jgi:hypothetical protein